MTQLTIAPHHALLLKAALFEAPLCSEAWEAWKEQTAGRTIDEPSKRILPLLYSSLTAKGVKDPALEALKPWYEQSRAKNQVLFGVLPALLQDFATRGIPTMLLKGAAMSVGHYRDPGTRPTDDLDLFVPAHELTRAVAALRAAGWESFAHGEPVKVVDSRFTHALQFYRPPALSVDLHCHLLSELCAPGTDNEAWKRSNQAKVNAISVTIPGREDLLLVSCVHGVRPRADVDLRWIADAFTLMTSGVDLKRAAGLALARGLGGFLGSALRILKDILGAPVPAEVLAQLEGAGVDPRVQSIHDGFEVERRFLLAKLRAHWAQIGLGIGSDRVRDRLAAAPAYLRFWCQAERLRDVPWSLIMKGFRRVGYAFGVYDYDAAVKSFLKPDSRRVQG